MPSRQLAVVGPPCSPACDAEQTPIDTTDDDTSTLPPRVLHPRRIAPMTADTLTPRCLIAVPAPDRE